MGIGDWGLGIGDWAQSPIPNPQIPNPQSPIPNQKVFIIKIKIKKKKEKKFLRLLKKGIKGVKNNDKKFKIKGFLLENN